MARKPDPGEMFLMVAVVLVMLIALIASAGIFFGGER